MVKFALGLDVSKRTVDACLLSSDGQKHRFKITNCLVGFQKLLVWLHGLHIDNLHVCLEPTGVYSRNIAAFLHGSGFHISQVNSFTVCNWGKAKKFRNKTDRIDAYLLADYCLKEQPPAWSPLPESHAALRELQVRLSQIDEAIRQEQNRLETITLGTIRLDIEEHIVQLSLRKKRLEDTAQELIYADSLLEHQYKILNSIIGIGGVSSRVLLALVNFSNFQDGRKTTSFAGLAPSQFQSGTSINKYTGISRRGNSSLRSAMYFPAMAAMQHNPQIHQFAQRLREKGKPPKVIIAAVMRKLLVLATTLIRKDCFYDPSYLPA